MKIEEFCVNNNFGNVLNITRLSGGLMHKMFKVETDKGLYAIKILNPEVMSRSEAYNNLVISETISNLAKDNGIVVSSALNINGDYLTKFNDIYYMIFDFVDGTILSDDEITVEHCKKIARILSQIHSLDYSKLGLENDVVAYKRLYDWEGYSLNSNFSQMPYREEYLNNYKKYNSILKRANERFNETNKIFTLCHRDMDPKNVMWSDGNPIVIDWESASLANPYQELLEDALCWSGFLSDSFTEVKFVAVFQEYTKNRAIKNVDWYSVICGNLVDRFGWLKYNVERSLGIISNDEEEMNLAENEVSKTMNEINRYLELIGNMYDIIHRLTVPESKYYDSIIRKIIDGNDILKGKEYQLITAGFTNTIYCVEDYIIKICTNNDNENRFKNEIDFYNKNEDNDNVPNLYVGDITKSVIPYYYEVMQRVYGKTLYETWYKLSAEERKNVILDIINILKTFHDIQVEGYDFNIFIKSEISNLVKECNIADEMFENLLSMCDSYFSENRFGLIHGDLHFDNFMYDNGKLSLLDFERYMVAPIDYDFRIFIRYSETPWLWASEKTDMLTVESDYQELMPLIIQNYDELKKVPYLEERLFIYGIIDTLNNYRDTKNPETLETVKNKIRKLVAEKENPRQI